MMFEGAVAGIDRAFLIFSRKVKGKCAPLASMVNGIEVNG